MTITFETDNDIIVYALEKIISYVRDYQYMFVAQSVWWLAYVIGLEKGLIIYIDNIRIRSEAYQAPSAVNTSDRSVYPDWVSNITRKYTTDSKSLCVGSTPQDLEHSEDSEGNPPDKVLRNCEKFLRESEQKRTEYIRKSQKPIETGYTTKQKESYKA
jgi:hypothetical protein